MKKYLKIALLVVVAAIFIFTFVFLYQKSKPKITVYETITPAVADLEKTTVATQVEIVVTPVVIQVETPGTAQVELPVVPPEEVQPSRFFFAVLSGVLFFAAYAPVTIGNKMIDALIYSVTYNGSYLAVEEIITIIVISIPPVKKALDYVKQMANSR